ncbi:MAG: ribose ABC transporter [Rhodobacteraceae bacterium]|nr:ribose ABC transporter [Paracoccaceae bacterium]
MLHMIDPVLSPDLLHTLASMGHGDDLVIVDANYPGTASGPPCIRADGISASAVLRGVLQLMPLDTFVPDPAITMQDVSQPHVTPDAVKDFQSIINETADNPADVTSLERFAFYERAREGFAVVQTGERRLYGCIILKKGIIRPET